MLRAIYASFSASHFSTPLSETSAVWGLLESFLEDHSRLLSGQTALLRAYRAEPWLGLGAASVDAVSPGLHYPGLSLLPPDRLPPPPPLHLPQPLSHVASHAPSLPSGWRLARCLLRDRLLLEEESFMLLGRPHRRLLEAVQGEIRRLEALARSPSPASTTASCPAAHLPTSAAADCGENAGAASGWANKEETGRGRISVASAPVSAPSSLSYSPSSFPSPRQDRDRPEGVLPRSPMEQELCNLDARASLENAMHLWARLETVVSNTIFLEGGMERDFQRMDKASAEGPRPETEGGEE